MMVTADFKINDCKHMEFGNPSAHTLGTSLVSLTLVYTFHRHFMHKFKIFDKTKSGIILVVSANLALGFIYAVGFSRVVKGVHTYN